MKRYSVRLSVCLSQHGPTAANLLLWAWQAVVDIYRLLQQWRVVGIVSIRR